MSYAYATLNQLKSKGWANIVTTDYDADLLRILQDASVLIDRLCHRQFQVLEGTRYLDGSASPLMFNDLDVLSLTTFALDQDGSQNYGTSLATTDYVLYPLNKPFKTYVKTSHITGVGGFASGIRAGVKLIGTFGYGDGVSATPYADSGAVVGTGNMTNSATTHALATNSGALFSAGNTIRIGSEQIYISAVTTDTLTMTRGMNGTTKASHTAGDTIYIYQYPGPIVEATLLQANRDWKRRESPTSAVAGSAETGIIPVSKGLDPDIAKHIELYIKRVGIS
jgi:hypothetical protein